jgi:hypothetical protein
MKSVGSGVNLPFNLPGNEPNPEVCDATDDHSSTTARPIITTRSCKDVLFDF